MRPSLLNRSGLTKFDNSRTLAHKNDGAKPPRKAGRIVGAVPMMALS